MGEGGQGVGRVRVKGARCGEGGGEGGQVWGGWG